MGESERKNLSQIARDSVEVTYHKLHHFLTESTWSAEQINARRLEVMNKCSQTRISRGFSLIIDDSGHRKSAPPALRFPQRKDGARSGNFTAGVGRQYIGEVGPKGFGSCFKSVKPPNALPHKTDNGNVVVTTHLYDGKKSLPLDIELYQHSSSLPEGKKDPDFRKKPELALGLIDKSLARGYRPGIILIDSGYGNNTTFLIELEKRKLNYLGGLAKNRKVKVVDSIKFPEALGLDALAESLPSKAFSRITINLAKTRIVWVATIEVEISRLEGTRKIAIAIDAPTFSEADDIDYFITNFESSIVTPQWIVNTYSERNWVEVFYREVKGWLGLKEYQVRGKKKFNSAFYLGILCLYFYSLAQANWGIKKALGKQTFKHLS